MRSAQFAGDIGIDEKGKAVFKSDIDKHNKTKKKYAGKEICRSIRRRSR